MTNNHPVGAPLAGAPNKTTATTNAAIDPEDRPKIKKTEQKGAEKLPIRNYEEPGV